MTENKTEKIKRRNKWLEIAAWILATLVLIGALVYYNFLAKEREIFVYGIGDMCPVFTVKTYEGETEGEYTFTHDGDKVVVINFWATWCAPCVAELPHFNELQENYSDDVTVVAFHQVDPKKDVQEFINGKGWGDYALTFAQDANIMGQGTATLYESLGGTTIWPITVIVDKECRITAVRQGAMDYSELEAMVLKALNG